MFRVLFVLFLLVPLAEIYLLIRVGGMVGAPATIFLVVFTAVLGAFLVRAQGLSTLAVVQRSIQRNEIPAVPLLEGVFILLAGALLMTPGFLTDTIGFLCLAPPVRRKAIAQLLAKGIVVGATRGVRQPSGGSGRSDGRVFEGEYHREDDP